MAKKVIIFIILRSALLFAVDDKAVYFSSDTPWLDQIGIILAESGYKLFDDTTNACYAGELSEYFSGDSLLVGVFIRKSGAIQGEEIGSFKVAVPLQQKISKPLVSLIWRAGLANLLIFGLFLLRFG